MFKEGNFTMVPNAFFDIWMKELREVELRVLLTIMRKTFGYQKKSDKIAISQLQDTTGSAKCSVINATQSLKKTGLIKINKDARINEYVVNKSILLNPPGMDMRPNVSENHTFDVQNSDTQKKEKKDEINYSRVDDISDIVEKWNLLFDWEITADNSKCLEMINKALETFEVRFILSAMIGRDIDDFYNGKHASLKDNPICFFPYPDTISNDHKRFIQSLYTYPELIHLTTTGQVKMSDYAIYQKNQWIHKKYLQLLNKSEEIKFDKTGTGN